MVDNYISSHKLHLLFPIKKFLSKTFSKCLEQLTIQRIRKHFNLLTLHYIKQQSKENKQDVVVTYWS